MEWLATAALNNTYSQSKPGVFEEKEAFARNEDGTYSVDMEKMKEASKALTQLILKVQGDGDYEMAMRMVDEQGVIPAGLQADLDLLSEAGIPVDIVFEQGPEMLGL